MGPPMFALKTAVPDSGNGTAPALGNCNKNDRWPNYPSQRNSSEWMVWHFVGGFNCNKSVATFECKREFHGDSLSPWFCAYFIHVQLWNQWRFGRLSTLIVVFFTKCSLCYTSTWKRRSEMQLWASWSYIYITMAGTKTQNRDILIIDYNRDINSIYTPWNN